MENRINDTSGRADLFKRIVLFVMLLLAFLIFLDLLILSLQISPDTYTAYLKKSSHLFFIVFFLGIITTAIVQSSSAISTFAVAMVAKGDLELVHAIPIIIGSNIGTTITPFIFSFVHSQRRGQFKRALSIAFAHNILNVLSAIPFMILEFQFGLLSHMSGWLGHHTYHSLSSTAIAPLFQEGILKPISAYMAHVLKLSWLSALIGFIGMYASIKGFVWLFANKGDAENSFVNKYVFERPYKAFFTGLLGTALVHSSSATLSILQTVANSYKVNITKSFVFIAGANIGTTFTALLAGLFSTETALQLAFAHLLFNVIGALCFGAIPFLKNTNIRLAEYLAKYFEKYRASLIIYIGFLFFMIPLLLIYIF